MSGNEAMSNKNAGTRNVKKTGKHRGPGLFSSPGLFSGSGLFGGRGLAAGAVGAGLACGLIVTGLTPAYAAPVDVAGVLRAGTLTAAQTAAVPRAVPFVAPVVTDGQGPVSGDPVGDGSITPGEESTVSADPVGAKVSFSGHKVASDLAVTVKELADGAARTAAAETGGTALNSAVEVRANDPAGKSITSFPADPTIVKHDGNAPDVVTDVDPGVALDLAIDTTRLGTKPGLIDPASVRIMTRENPGDPWTELPSYYDPETKRVKGESDHLSQFVVIGTPFVPPAGPRIVLDPDDDVAHTAGPNGSMTELPQNVKLANAVASMLADTCRADVLVTRHTASPAYMSPDLRAAMAAAHKPDLTVTMAFDALYGHPWGVSVDGGTKAYSRGHADDNAVTASLVKEMPAYTGRPANTASMSGTGTPLPYPELGSLPGALVHLETLYLDHNYDRPVIDNGFTSITNGVFTGLGKYLESKGFDCTNPATGGWPTKPSAAALAKWRNLGFHNFQAYGAEPVSFTTGNLIEKFPLFTLTGPGTQTTDLSLVYNSQDGRPSRAGAGISFGLGARVQRFSDGSVLAVRGDGASYVFTGNGAGGYTPEPGTFNTLTEAGGGKLKLASPDGESWVFDAGDIEGIGELIKHADRQGNTTTLAYGAAGANALFRPLASITDAAGQTIKAGSDGAGRITSFTHPDGRVWRLGYDGAGNLATITEPDGRTRSFTYDGAHQLLTATDALGVKYLRNQYDASGRVVKQWDAQGTQRSFVYNDAAGTTAYVDNEGHKTVYTRDSAYRVTKITDASGAVKSFAYDTHNQVTAYTDEDGVTTRYSYDKAGRLTKSDAPEGDTRSYTYTPSGDLATATDHGGPAAASRTVSLDNNADGLPVRVHLPDGTTLSNSYTPAGDLASTTDGAGNTTRFTYDARGNLVSSTDPEGDRTSYTYDSANRVVSMTDPNGNTTSYAWDTADRLTTQTDPLGGVTALAYDGNNHVTSMTDPAGAVTKYTWDALFRVTSVTDPDGGKTSYGYNREDELVKVTDPVGAVTAFTLDPLYRVIKTTDPNGGAWAKEWNRTGTQASATDPTGAKTIYAYDTAGRMTTVTAPDGSATKTSYDPVGKILSVTDPAGGVTSTAYDAVDRAVAVSDQTGKKTLYAYDKAGNPTTVTDRRGQTWQTVFDKAGRAVSVTDPTGAKTAYALDGNGNTVRITDPLGRTTSVAYDALNRPTSLINPAGDTSRATYDPVGRVIADTDPLGNTTRTSYTPAGRVAAVTDPAGGTTHYAWDPAGNQTSTRNPNGVVTAYGYDPAGQLTKVIENAKAGKPSTADTNVTTRYSYTPAGNLATTTDPNRHTTRYTWNTTGHLTGETNPLGTSFAYAYDPRGLLTTATDGNGQTTKYAYTARGELAKTSYPNGQGVDYGYDGEGALITMNDSLGASGFTYSPRGELTSQTDAHGKTLNYAYDPAGQLTTLNLPDANRIGYSYDAASRPTKQTSPWGTLAYTYDKAGRTVKTSRSNNITTSYAYDPAGRPTTITHATLPTLPATGPAGAKTTPASTGFAGAASVAGSLAPATASGLSQDPKACTTAAGYLARRTLPENGATGTSCQKTSEYLPNRTLPAVNDGIKAGQSITLNYTYDPAGNVTNRTRTNGTPATTKTAVASTGTGTGTGKTVPTVAAPVPVPNKPDTTPAPGAAAGTTDKRSYSYDALDRLTKSVSATGGATNTYAYDAAGNRTTWTTSDAPDTTTRGDALTVKASFNDANQLVSETRTRSGQAPATVGYAYDGNGNRTKQTIPGGATTKYGYTPTGQPASISRDGYTTEYARDGLGRALTTTNTTELTGSHKANTETIDTVFNGLYPAQTTTTGGGTGNGTSTLVRDNLGKLALQSVPDTDEARWAFLDRLGSTIAHTNPETKGTAGTLDQLADYSDFGVQEFGTTGWDGHLNYSDETTNPTLGTSTYHARSYDPFTGTFTGTDQHPGLLGAPQSLNRYNYTLNNPATLIDRLGNDPIESNGTDWNSVSPRTYGLQDDWVTKVPNYTPGPWRTGYLYPTPVIPAPARPAPAPAPSPTSYAPLPTVGPGYTFNQMVQRSSTYPYHPAEASQPQVSDRHDGWNWELTGTIAGIVAGVAICAATAGVGCVVGAAVAGAALSTAGYAADHWGKVSAGDVAGHFVGEAVLNAIPLGKLAKVAKFARFGKTAGQGLESAEAAADAMLAAGRTSGAAAELRIGGQLFTDVSTGGAKRVLNPAVKDALDAVPEAQQAGWHGACAEMGCLSQALNAGVNPAGGLSRAVAIGISRPGHGLPKKACSSCSAVLDAFGVRR